MGVINHHTLSDFRAEQGAALEELSMEVLGVLSSEGMVELERVMHDGMKVKACAGADSFGREARLQKHLEAARVAGRLVGRPRFPFSGEKPPPPRLPHCE